MTSENRDSRCKGQTKAGKPCGAAARSTISRETSGLNVRMSKQRVSPVEPRLNGLYQ